jgi:predicted nuclease of predicted toxin-antitoxin system
VRELRLTNAEDIDIWDYARKNDYVIVTFDADFYDIGLINGCPPKIVWLRTGNLTTNQIADLLRKNLTQISDFYSHPELTNKACFIID